MEISDSTTYLVSWKGLQHVNNVNQNPIAYELHDNPPIIQPPKIEKLEQLQFYLKTFSILQNAFGVEYKRMPCFYYYYK